MFGSIFPPDGKRHSGFARIVRAVSPDVLALQEVNPAEMDRLAEMMDRILPLGQSRRWQIHGAADNVIISRYPLRLRDSELVVPRPLPGNPDFQYGQGMVLIDLPDRETDTDVYLIAMHNRSRVGRDYANQRQAQSDSVVRWVRDLKRGDAIAKNTPLIIAGDMNVLANDSRMHFTTLLTGDIADEGTFGADAAPDWDGTALADASPSHNAAGEQFYTWRNDSEPYPPGQLSRILYTDSVMRLQHGFVLNTMTMGLEEREEFGLLESDGLLDGIEGIFDHMPVVVDLVMTPSRPGATSR